MRRGEQVAGVMILAFVAVVLATAWAYPWGSSLRKVGPGFFPVVMLTILAGLTLILIFRSAKHSGQDRPVAWPASWAGFFLANAAIVGYGLALPRLGFAPTIFLFSLVLFRFGHPHGWLWPALGSAINSALCMLVFQTWLGTPFPRGVLGL